jgi:TonB-like protein
MKSQMFVALAELRIRNHDVLPSHKCADTSEELDVIAIVSGRRFAWILSVVMLGTIVGGASSMLRAQSNSEQGSIAISADEAASHLLEKVEPVYPAFDKAAGIQGTVRVHVVIGTDGRVKVLYGHSPYSSLYQAAQSAVTQYVWRPFEKDGRPVDIETDVSVTFELPKNVPPPPPPPSVSLRNFSEFSGSLGNLPPQLQVWIAEHLRTQVSDTLAPSSEFPAVEADLRDKTLPPVIEVVQIAEKKDIGVKVYIYRAELQELCGDGNCPIELVEQDASGIRVLAETDGWGYYVCYNSRFISDWPVVFFSRHMSASETDVFGYAKAGGSWGRLYCGEINVSYEQIGNENRATETDDLHVCD